MWITLLVMAVAVSLEPFRIGMTLLLLNRPRPALQLLAFLAGGFAMGVTVGLIVLFVLRPAVGSAHGRAQRLGMANLDWLVLYTELKAQVDANTAAIKLHTHLAGALVAGMVPVTGVTGTPVNPGAFQNLTAGIRSSNVVAKK